MSAQNSEKSQAYDIIGDIHGHADALEALLCDLGYKYDQGYYQHPEGRKVIFLGDYIDRGPDIPRALELVMAMWYQGSALAVLGNHEVNALAYHSLGIDGNPLREHTERSHAQHKETLEQFAECPMEWQGALEWFRELPIYLDLEGLRAVHAAWDDKLLIFFPDGRISRKHIADAQGKRDTHEGMLIKRATCGVEIALPDGVDYIDVKGVKHPDIRAAWWKDLYKQTYAGALFPAGGEAPDIAIPHGLIPCLDRYGPTRKPAFFGHYRLNPHEMPLVPLENNLACLDYSVAREGLLVAYRWDGESQLDQSKFVTVDSTTKPESKKFTGWAERMPTVSKAIESFVYDPMKASRDEHRRSGTGLCADPDARKRLYKKVCGNVKPSSESQARAAAEQWLGPAIKVTSVIDNESGNSSGQYGTGFERTWKVYYELLDSHLMQTGGEVPYLLVEKDSYKVLGRGIDRAE